MKSRIVITFEEEANLTPTLDVGKEVDVVVVEQNELPLADLYNIQIETAYYDDVKHLILVHGDVHFSCDPVKQSLYAHEKFGYDVVGVAGGSKIQYNPTQLSLWHLLTVKGHHHGAVAHGIDDKKFMTSFGEYPHEVILLDGVFLSLMVNKVYSEEVWFDERCPSRYHFYDLNFCMNALKRGLKLGVGDIPITHASPGLSNITEEFKQGNDYFVKKHLL